MLKNKEGASLPELANVCEGETHLFWPVPLKFVKVTGKFVKVIGATGLPAMRLKQMVA